MEKKSFYITTSIPYTNAAPHIGHAFEFIQADVIARHQRNLGKDVFFLTGTDEHGLKTLRAAELAGKEVMEFANETSGIFRELLKAYDISNDGFIRTTDASNHQPAVYKLWEKFVAQGDIYKKKYQGWYCPGCESFKTAKELLDGKCVIHQKPVEDVEEENYFFRLSKHLPKVKQLLEDGVITIIPVSKKAEVLSMIEGGLDDISFSRSKEKYWGFPVPGDDSQVVYVWADALPNYISGLGYAENAKEFKAYWPADVHCIGKDIVKFHAIYWPAMLLSADLPLPKSIFVHGHLTMNGQKMSKSLGNVVDPFEAVKKYGVDAVRYYLLREVPATEDGDFSYEKFETRYNADLAGGIGNLLSRTLGIASKIPNSKFQIPRHCSSVELQKAMAITQEKYEKSLEGFKFNEALASVWEFIAVCDKYINEEKLWETKKPEVISDLCLALNQISQWLLPFMPGTAQKIAATVASRNTTMLFPRIDNKN